MASVNIAPAEVVALRPTYEDLVVELRHAAEGYRALVQLDMLRPNYTEARKIVTGMADRYEGVIARAEGK
jgi:hypothetical protein